MTNKPSGSLRNLELMLCILISLAFWSCEKKNSGPGGPAQGCGSGNGDYSFSTWGIPQTFDCNSVGSFSTEMQPWIDKSYSGLNRLFFKLQKGSRVYVSNYAELDSGYTASQQLEFGGSLASDTYSVTGVLQNIQLNSTCRESIYIQCSSWLGDIIVTQFANPQKMMNIEYNCQVADTLGLWNYNVFSSPKTAEYVYNAFRIANTDRHWIVGDTALACSLLVFDNEAIVRFISFLKQDRNKMFLCGIKGFRDTQGNLLDYLGITVEPEDTVNLTPTDSTGSLIAVKACINYAGTQYKVDFNDLVTSTTVHELGHQRAIYDPNHQRHTRFCRMNAHPIYPRDRSTYLNPHFCDYCINKIKNVNW